MTEKYVPKSAIDRCTQKQLEKDWEIFQRIEEFIPLDIIWDIVAERLENAEEKLNEEGFSFPKIEGTLKELIEKCETCDETERQEVQEVLDQLSDPLNGLVARAEADSFDWDLMFIEDEIDGLIYNFVRSWIDNLCVVYDEEENFYFDLDDCFQPTGPTADKVLKGLGFNKWTELFEQLFTEDEVIRILEVFVRRIKVEIERDGKFDLVDKLIILGDEEERYYVV